MEAGNDVPDWFLKYHDDIFNFLIYYTGSIDVEDLVQEVFIRAVRNIHKFKGNAQPKTWLYTIARNVAIDERRKRRKRRKEEIKQSRYQLNLISKEFLHSSPEELLRLSETKAELYATMKTLKQTYYDVLIYRGIKELSVTETSQVLNWSESKVNLTYHRALKALEKKMGGSLYE